MASKNRTNMKDRIRGLLFCLLWYFSILFGFFMFICPILPLAVLYPKLYRKWSDLVFGMWEPFPVAMMEILFGVRIYISGDRINPFEGSLVIMNHRTRLDWNFFWAGLFHGCQPHSHNMKFVLKSPIMHLPGPGWVMQACSFLFIHRNWEKDQKLLAQILDYLRDSEQVCQILIFPEGTDLSERNIERSHKFADEHNLDRYYRVLHPKTRGFIYLASRMRSNGQLKAIYDLTIGYPKTLPQTELDMLRGKFPEEVHFHVKRYSASSIPYREEELKQWLNEIWQEKEKKLQKFYSSGSFIQQDYTPDCSKQNSTNELIKMCKYSDNNIIDRAILQNGISRDMTQRSFDDFHSLNAADNLNSSQRKVEQSEIVKQNLINNEIHSSGMQSSTQSKKEKTNAMQNASNFSVNSSESYFQNHFNCNEDVLNNQYRPSNLLYLSLLFWTSLVLFTLYGLFTNFYIQIWISIHFVMFVALSFVSNGFHQLLASFHLYRCKRNSRVIKKSE